MLVFDFGERRHVILDVYSCKNEKFEIQSASYELADCSGKIESQDVCSIYEHSIDTIVEPKHKGDYMLKITYKILDETLIEVIGITVM